MASERKPMMCEVCGSTELPLSFWTTSTRMVGTFPVHRGEIRCAAHPVCAALPIPTRKAPAGGPEAGDHA